MKPIDILSQVEQSLDLVFAALHTGDAEALNSLAAVVLSYSQDLLQSEMVVQVPRNRLKQVAAQVQSLREALVRHAVITDQALQALIPATQSHTYGSGTAGVGVSPYGAVPRASGRMRQVLIA